MTEQEQDQNLPFRPKEKVLIPWKDGTFVYLATILQMKQNEDGTRKYKVHYMKYKAKHDQWVPEAKLIFIYCV